jgi:tetratricopeptide (TPR) repeat protein
MQTDLRSPVYFILHLPKTAGESIESHLDDHCGAGVLWRPAPPPKWARTVFGRRYKLGRLPDLERVRVVVGHHLGRSLERYFPGREIRRVVLLRDPVSLQVSYYNYVNMTHLAEGRGTYSFDLHLKALRRNFVSHILLWRWREIPWPVLAAMTEKRKYEVLNQSLSAFWFVGAHTDCDRLIAAIARDLDVPSVAWRRNTTNEWCKMVDWPPLKASELSPAARDAILANNPIDQALWESWRNAGFDAASVRPPCFHPSSESASSLHSIVRPAFLYAKIFLEDWLPRFKKAAACLEPITTIKSTSVGGGRRSSRDLLIALDEDPENPDIWRTILTRCRRAGQKFRIPDQFVGSVADAKDADLCVLKGEVFLRCGRCDAAKRFLRQASTLGKSRRQAREITLRAASQDPDFQALIAKADRARDRASWRAGERHYRAALALYPGHFGYMVQYAHCLKEQGKFVAAEIYYRSARALGAPLKDVHEHLAFVASRQGYQEASDAVSGAGWITEPVSFMDGPPAKADVDLAYLLLLERKPVNDHQVLQVLRTQRTVREVLIWITEQGRDSAASDKEVAATAAAGRLGAPPLPPQQLTRASPGPLAGSRTNSTAAPPAVTGQA